MRSNVRKMWTALLAVLFAAAVGFGLWFAFAPAARPASVQAAEEPSVTFTVDSSKTLYSWYPTTGLISNRFITGTIDLADGSTAQNLQAYAEKTTFNIYKQVENEGQTTYQKVSDFRPDAGVSPNLTYTRYIEAVVALDDGRTITSEKKAVTVTADEITSFEASAVGQQTTFYALETVSEERLIVRAMYKNGGMSNILEISMAQLDEDGEPLYGGWYIVYQQEEGKTEEEDSSKYLEYGDIYFTVYYKEGNQEKDAKVNINVIEAYVNAPVTPSLSNFKYDETPHSNTFTEYDAEKMTYSLSGEGVSASLNEDNFVVSATNVGTYSVTFTVKEGYQFLNTPAGATSTVATRDDETTYLQSVTYTWKITQASIDRVTVAGNWKDGWTFGTPDAAPTKDNVELNILYEGSSETVTKSPDEVGAKAITFYFSGTANDGTTITDSTDLPTQAGNYTWRVELTGMKNFNDFTGSSGNGGVGSFTIQKKSLTVPELNYLSFTYNKQDQAPAPKVSVTENDPYTFSVTEQKDVGDDYTAAFSLKNTNNYEWASGSSAQIDGATATYTWVIVKASVTVPTLTSKEYNGQPQKADISSDLYTAEQGNNWINAGDYNVTLTLSDSTNYKWKDGTSTQGDNDEKTTVTFIITQKKVEIIWSNTTLTYNGENQAPTATINNKIGNDDVSLSVSGAETNANTDGATYTATASLKGNAKDNYTLDGAENTTCSFTISPYQIGVEGTLSIAMGGWMYGSTPNAPSGMSIASNSQSIATAGGDTLTGEYLYYTSNDSSAQPLSGVPTDAGSYWVRYHAYSDTTNFTEAYSDFVSFTIAKKTIGIKWGTLEFIYNGQPQQPTAKPTGVVDGDTLTLTVSVESEHTNAGDYTATASLSGKDAKNYVLADTKPKPFTIAKKSIGIDWGTTKFTYNGEEQAPTAEPTGVVDGDGLTLTVTVSGEHKNAGGYTATAALAGEDARNYSLPDDATIEFVIHKATVSVGNYISEPEGYQGTNENDRLIVYSGVLETSQLIIKTSDLFTVGDRKNSDGQISTAVTVGQYSVTLTLNDANNYKWSGGSDDDIDGAEIVVKYSITQSQFAITVSLDKTTWTYGDKAGTPSISGNTSGGAQSFQYYASEADAEKGENRLGKMPTDAGTYWVVGIVAATDDYAQSVSTPVSFTIEKVKIGITWGSETSFTYDGTPQAPTATATRAVNGDVLTLTLEGQATNVGTYTAKVTAITINGEAATNYQLPADGLAKEFTITQRAISVTLNEYTVTYNGNTLTGSFTTSGHSYNGKMLFTIEGAGLCGSDTLEGTFTYPSQRDAGDYAWGGIAWSNDNYQVNVTNLEEKMFVIDKAPITVQIENKSSAYGNDIVDLTYTVSGDKYDDESTIFSLSTEATNTSNVGEYAITGTATGENSKNYSVTFSGSNDAEGVYTITERALIITVTAKAPIQYGDAAPETLENYNVTLEGVLDSEKSALENALTFDVLNYQSDSNKGNYTVNVKFADSVSDLLKNYSYTAKEGVVATCTLTVEARAITVTIKAQSSDFDEDIVTLVVADNEEIETEFYTITGDIFDNASSIFSLQAQKDDRTPLQKGDNAGTYNIKGTAKNENYEVTFENETGSYTISPKALTLTSVVRHLGHDYTSAVYDGAAWEVVVYAVNDKSIIFTGTYQKKIGEDNYSDLASAPVNAGEYRYVVEANQTSGNYTTNSGLIVSFTIAQREVEAVWAADNFTYDGTDQKGKVTAGYKAYHNGKQDGTQTPLSVSISSGQSEFKNAGTEYTFTAAFATDAEKGNYKFGDQDGEDSVTQTFSITQAEITVAIKPQTSIYGENIVDLTVANNKDTSTDLYSIEGTLYDNADTIFTLQAQKDERTPLQKGDDAGEYAIKGMPKGENSDNYKVKFVNADVSTSEVGTYTITRRPVQISLDDFSMIYGTNISAVDNHEKLVSLSGLDFTLGTDTTGSPFLTKDRGAEAAAKRAMTFGFTGSGAYDAESAAGTKWTVKASLSDQASDDLKNYTFVADTSTMTVIPRPITVTLPQPGSNGSTSYTYGTAALQKAFSTFEATVSIDDKWAGYGDAIVFNDNAEGGVYTLVVKNEDGEVTTLSASTPVGTYTLDGKKGGDSNYSVTFTSEQTFKVTAAEFKVNAQDPVSVSVGYTGKNYYFRSDAEAKENPADTYLFNYGLNVTTADFVLLEGDIAYTWDFKVGDNSLTCLTNAGTYEVSYTVTADNFETFTGSFTVTISQATNKWTAGMTTTDGGAYKQASWTYGNPEKYSSLNWTDTFTGYTPSTQFVAAFGEMKIEYYKTRTEAEGGYKYSDQITDHGTFFGFETAVGTYYVKVFVEATDNFTGLTAHGTIVVSQRAVDIDWAANNITVDGVTHEGTNTTIGFDNTLMTVDTESLPQGLTIVGNPNESGFTGDITVKVEAEGTTQFYLYFELKDPDNYCWEESATVSGDKGERIQINFTTNALQNNVTFKFKGQDDDPSQNTSISISFGTELTYRFATSREEVIGSEHLLIFADSTLADETQNYYISFARTTQEDEEPKNDTYSISSLDGADAGYYWLRVQVYPTSDSSYGYGIGYLKICVTQQEITQDVINSIDFGSGDELHFTYDGRSHQPGTEGVPSYLHVEFSGSATNVCDGGVTVTATFTIADKNYKFADDVSPTREITVVIDPYEITHIVWSDREYTYNGTDQKEDVYAYFVDVFGVEHRLRVTADGDFKNVTADGTTFTAVLELYEAQEDFCIQNYKFVEDLAERTHVYKMAKATVEIGIGDAEAVYTGEPIEIDQTQYALRTAISLIDPEILKFLSMIRLIAVDTEGNPAVNVGEYQIILEENEWAYTNIEIVFNDSYAGQLTVSPAVLEVPVLDETQFVYNGTVQKPNVTGVDGVYTVVNEGGTDVGRNYYVTLTLVTHNYRWETTGDKTVTLNYEIVQAEYSFSFDVSDTVYNGAPVSVNAPELPAGEDEASVTYYYTGTTNAGVEYSNSDAPTEAGSYTVRVTISGMKNYKDAEASAEFTIERAPIKVSLTFKPQVDGGNGWVYGTAPKDIYELGESSNPGQGGVTATYSTGSWSGSAIPTEVGEYTLTVTVAETANYKSGSAKVEFEIVQASEDELSFTVSIEGWTYGEEPHAPSVIWGGGLTGHPDQISPVYTYAIAKADGETYSDKDFSATVPTNAGSYVVKATFAETDHYGELSAMCKFVIGKAAAAIDTSGVKTNFTYNGRAQAVGGAVLNHSETTLVYSPDTVTAVGSYTVTISAAASTNYTAATATVTVTVSRASAGFSVSIDDWTYGETPSRYIISGGSGGSVTVTYSGTTNAGVKYSSSKVPTEAGEYTITVVMGASGNFLGGTAHDSFTIHRAKAEAELTLAGWMYGEEPNAYVLTPEFLRGEVVRVIYTDGTYYSEAVPQDVGSYTLTVTYGETDNYLGGEVSCKFSIVPYGLGLTVTLEGWTYGDKANEPIVTGAGGIGLMYAYTGTANDGTAWNSNTAPEKAGSYTLTVTVTKAGSYTDESASTDFVIARRLLSAPAWDEEGMRELIEVCSGDRMTRAILGFDMSLMNAQSATAQFMFDGTGAASVTANIHGVYTIVVSLKDAANYGWADLNEGETLTDPVTLTWTLTERVISLLWLIILLAVLVVIALIVLIVLLKKGRKPDGTDTGKGDVRLSSVAPVGLLLVVAPLGEIIAVVVLGVVLAAVVIADIAVGVRNAKRAKAAENAQEPVPAYGDEAAAEGEAYPGTEAPADDGAEVASDEGGMLQ